MKKILSIVETAYRATIEEQDDTILWLNHALKNAGAEISILLLGNAVHYVVRSAGSPKLSLGDSIRMNPPDVAADLSKMIDKNVAVFFAEEDLRERGLVETELIQHAQKISRSALPALFEQFDQIWYW
jgi:sulfur relay (sulfurtransferase) DsrF/TusC family protein